MIILPLRGSILQAGTCQILSLAENPRWSRVWKNAKLTHKDMATTIVPREDDIILEILREINKEESEKIKMKFLS